MSDLPCPISHSSVYLALRRAARVKRRRPKQSLGLTKELLVKMLSSCPDTLSGQRDAALLGVGYDTLCRSCELSWMRVEDISLEDARIYIPRAKSDPFGDGRFARLTERTQDHLSMWVERSQIKRGPLFRGLHNGQLSDAHMATSSIRRIVKCAARRAGLETEAQHLSGHSMRVGAAQDMMKAGCHTIEIMTAGGWKNYEVVARYVEHSDIKRV
ncbi:MAG: tyrosine-type recombinase/integrase [Pseudomonadota bacterium]